MHQLTRGDQVIKNEMLSKLNQAINIGMQELRKGQKIRAKLAYQRLKQKIKLREVRNKGVNL